MLAFKKRNEEVDMGRFQHLIEEARKRAEELGMAEENLIIPTLEENKNAPKAQNMRLPYSSDPEPLDVPWG